MKLPWVSRLAYEMALERLTRAEERIDSLLEHTRRMDRIDRGAAELAPVPKPRREPMPGWFREKYVDCWEAHETKTRREEQVVALHKRGLTWEKIGDQIDQIETMTKSQSAENAANL